MMGPMKAWMISLLVAVVACAPTGPTIPALPSAGGPAWTEITSEHFIMWTDAPAARGVELLARMEHHRAVVLASLDGHSSNAKMFVLALRDAAEVAAFVPKEFAAYSWPWGNPMRRPMIVLAADTSEEQNARQVITHELTHIITYEFLPNQPQWFAEGIATYFATAKFYGRTTVEIGRPLDYHARELREHHAAPLASVFGCHEHGCEDEHFYATAWALFAFLVNNHRAELLRYVERLAHVPRGGKPPEWDEVVPELPLASLDHELNQWLAHGQIGIGKLEVEPPDAKTTQRPVAEADILAARALLRASFQRGTPEAEAALQTAIAADKTNVLARMVEMQEHHSVPFAEAQAVAEAHPDDWRAWWLAGYTASQAHQAKASFEARTRLCALAATDAAVDAPPGFCPEH